MDLRPYLLILGERLRDHLLGDAMTLQDATGLYWRCSRTLRGHCYGTPVRAELQLQAIALLDTGRVSELAKHNSECRFKSEPLGSSDSEPKQASVIDAFSLPPRPGAPLGANYHGGGIDELV